MVVEVKPLRVAYIMLSLLSAIKHYGKFESDSSCVPLYCQYFDIVGSSSPFYRKPLPLRCSGDIRSSAQVVEKNILKLTIK